MLFLSVTSAVSAHVVVRPKEVLTASFQTFTMGVPNEKDIPTTGVRLVIPDGLNYVSPNVKPGWRIEIKKSGEGEEAKVTEIIWTGGSIPVGQRDDFLFSAQVPSIETNMQWKAYQTYSDGTVVAWDQETTGGSHDSEDPNAGPYSETQIVDHLSSSTPELTEPKQDSGKALSIVAMGLSAVAIGLNLTRK